MCIYIFFFFLSVVIFVCIDVYVLCTTNVQQQMAIKAGSDNSSEQ